MAERDRRKGGSRLGFVPRLLKGRGQIVGGVAAFGSSGAIVIAGRAAPVQAWIIFAIAVVYSLRWPVHVRQGYFDAQGDAGRRLGGLMRKDGVLCLVSLAAGVSCLARQTPAMALAGSLLTWPWMGYVSGRMVKILERNVVRTSTGDRLTRSSEWLRKKRRWIEMQDAIDANPTSAFRALAGVLKYATKVSEVSSLIAVLTTLGFGVTSSVLQGWAYDKVTGPSSAAKDERRRSGGSDPPKPIAARRPATGGASGPDDTYAGRCGSDRHLAENAPSPQRELLRAQFIGDLGIDGFGAGVAGCGTPASPVKAGSGLWWVSGWCGSGIRSVAVAGPRGASFMLQQVALAAERLILSHQLTGASNRREVGNGNLQVLRTTAGDSVLVRRTSVVPAAGERKAGGRDGACDQPKDDNVGYEVLEPSLSRLWVRLIEAKGWTWPVEDRSTGRPDRYVFLSEAGDVVARARCAHHACTMIVAGAKWRARTGTRLKVSAIVARAPKPTRLTATPQHGG